ncbi:hypothetical protein QZQ04_01665 [Serratia marcescens]|uniref:MrpH family fimbial adhesin n=1 Tax=Serratia marcescens TaxID=615 RepID=UPI00277796D6|nr:hypothetical protein [Serratia marcescens]MDP8633459.1 hypothetical protein [Serratia marcescens]MDP8866959.1 hypothetical protein [Serratia marcescens]
MLKFFLIAILFVSSAGAYATVTAEWTLSDSGALSYVVTAAEPRPLDPDGILKCGNFLQSPQCYVQARIGFPGDTVSKDYIQIKGDQRFSTVVSTWVASGPRGYIGNWSYLVEKNGGVAPCIMFDLYSDSRGGVGVVGTFGSTCTGSATPPPIKPPPPPLSCYLMNNIVLQHGTLAADEVTGHRAQTTARVYCTGAARVRLKVLSYQGGEDYNVKLRSDGSLVSLLSINGTSGSALLDVPAIGGKEVTFSSLLLAYAPLSSGSFSGSAVAVVEVI